MQRHRRYRHVSAQERSSRARHPMRGRADDIVPITMFERKNQLAPVVTIENRSAPLAPGAGSGQAIVTEFGLPRPLPWQRNAAGFAA